MLPLFWIVVIVPFIPEISMYAPVPLLLTFFIYPVTIYSVPLTIPDQFPDSNFVPKDQVAVVLL